jgi:DNA-directed RNA polymerase subunit RPC12/RpoP
MYRCEKCGRLITLEELREKVEGGVKCPKCQHRILIKVRQQRVKTVKAI